VRGTKAKERRRYGAQAAAAVVERHNRLGTCPSCGTEVETYASMIRPGERQISFGCASCDPLAAYGILIGKRAREWEHLRN
jgi:hypothetical protein